MRNPTQQESPRITGHPLLIEFDQAYREYLDRREHIGGPTVTPLQYAIFSCKKGRLFNQSEWAEIIVALALQCAVQRRG